jgi:hypothetical protein
MSDTYDMRSTGAGHGELARLLAMRGWSTSAHDMTTAVRAYQTWWGLVADGWAGAITERSLMMPRICGLPDRRASRAAGPDKFTPEVAADIRWAMHSHPRNRGDDVAGVFTAAWAAWADVCGIKVRRGLPDSIVHVRKRFDRIDRSGGTLAWSHLAPLAGRSYLEQVYDVAEPWHFGLERPGDRRRIWLLMVAIHEIGHALGIDHIGGDTGDVMNPIYAPALDGLQAGDIAEAERRYGPSIVLPPPPAADGRAADAQAANVSIGKDEWAGILTRQPRRGVGGGC